MQSLLRKKKEQEKHKIKNPFRVLFIHIKQNKKIH